MCGISGYVRLDGRPLSHEVDSAILARMADSIHHRGPDDRQVLIWENVGIAFNRLSIVDVDGGQQPFETPGGRVSAVVNGEIYNHRELRRTIGQHSLRTRSDCEVVPYLYLERGLRLFDDVNGMFAAVVLDRRDKRLLLARDRLGIKPLFYCRVEERKLLLFASELKALFAHPAVPRRFDWVSALSRSTRTGSLLPSYFIGIDRLLPASMLDLSLTDGSARLHRYWQLPDRAEEEASRSPRDYAEEYRELLRDSVHKRLMSDVPFGIFLSGGIDSTIVASLAAEKQSFPTFSVLSESTLANGDAACAHEAARVLTLANHQVCFDLDRHAIEPDDWRRILWYCELFEVNAEQLYKYFLHAFAKQAYPNLKVMLLGQGSDEFTGGYIESVLGGHPPWTPERWKDIDSTLRQAWALISSAKLGISLTYADLVARGVITADFLHAHAAHPGVEDTWRLYAGYYRTNLDHHLWHEDRTSSAHSIESRVPFLDHRLVEHLARIPRRHHAELFTDKKILRMAAHGLVAPQIVDRPKGYFFYGKGEQDTFRLMHSIVADEDGALLEQALRGSRRTDGPLDEQCLRAFVAEVGKDPGKLNTYKMLSLVNMGVLADMVIGEPPAVARRAQLPVYDVSGPALSDRLCAARQAVNASDQGELVVDLCTDCTLVEIHRGGTHGELAGRYCLSAGGKLFPPLRSPGWIRFLRRIDGIKSVEEIVVEEGLNRSRTYRYVTEALDQGFLVVRQECSSRVER
jgi:asparagine synthase (glutamine-hydrolysing)